MEDMGPYIPGFGVGGHGYQEVRDIPQGGGSSGATIRIRDVVGDPTHWQDAGGLSPPGVLTSEKKKNS